MTESMWQGLALLGASLFVIANVSVLFYLASHTWRDRMYVSTVFISLMAAGVLSFYVYYLAVLYL